ncbi:MAG TPA: tRNA lysidine(34) synthetase TilS [Terriglobales bacterium]
MIDRVHAYIREYHLLQPGDRVAVAVSGGADSVALLRLLLELRSELGLVLAVAHFHHGIRGAEADADQEFVRELAAQFDLELHLAAGDAPAHARLEKSSLESAARELRHGWFVRLVSENCVTKVATAHTLDDQAETVLMRLLRGASARGLAGIFPTHQQRHLIRPLLAVTRREVEAYLKALSQPWREDSTNRDFSHMRNRVRHQLLPLLERDFNPAVRHTLADGAELARAEAEYWSQAVAALLPSLVRPGEPSRSGRATSGAAAGTLALDLVAFQKLPLALRRQVLHAIGEQMGVNLEFSHIERLARLGDVYARAGGKCRVLPGGLMAVRSFRELRFSRSAQIAGNDYQYWLPVPGQVAIPELGSVIRARLVIRSQVAPGSAGTLLDRTRLAPRLAVRNWRPGDRFFPARTKGPKKLKELLEPGRTIGRVSPAQRKSWPVVESAGEIVWVRGFPVPEAVASSPQDQEAVLIEETEL